MRAHRSQARELEALSRLAGDGHRSSSSPLPSGVTNIVLATWVIRSKTWTSSLRMIFLPACQHRKVGVQSDVVIQHTHARTTILSHDGENFFYGLCFHRSPAAEGWLLGGALLSLCWLDKTAQDLLAALYPR